MDSMKNWTIPFVKKKILEKLKLKIYRDDSNWRIEDIFISWISNEWKPFLLYKNKTCGKIISFASRIESRMIIKHEIGKIFHAFLLSSNEFQIWSLL